MEFIYLNDKLQQEVLPLDEWIVQHSLRWDEPPQLLRHCPDGVRHAIWMHSQWHCLARSSDPAVRALAVAFVWAMRTRLEIVQQADGKVAGVYPQCHVRRLISRLMFRLLVRLMVAKHDDRVDWQCRLGTSDFLRTASDPDDSSKCTTVSSVSEREYHDLRDSGRLVRCPESVQHRFLSALRPLLQPYFSQACDATVPSFGIAVERPRSSSPRKVIPLTLLHAMQQITEFLPHDMKHLRHTIHRQAAAEIRDYMERREDVAMKVLANRGDLQQMLIRYDAQAIVGYLSPRFEPYCVNMDPRSGIGGLDIPGLNGKTVAQVALEQERRVEEEQALAAISKIPVGGK